MNLPPYATDEDLKRCVNIISKYNENLAINLRKDEIESMAIDIMNISYSHGGDYSEGVIKKFAEVYYKSSSKLILSAEFKDENWNNYLVYCKAAFGSIPDKMKNSLKDINIPEDVKMVAISRLNTNALNWLLSNVPALENSKPVELVNTEDGLRAVKEALLRLPD